MTDTRLITAQWILERQLAWIAAADAKAGVVVAICTAMLAALAAVFVAAKVPSTWAITMSFISAAAVAVGLASCAISLLPRTQGPKSSLLFFGTIEKMGSADYVQKLINTSEEGLLEDWATQIHRNAEIAALKHLWVRRAVGWSFLAALPWLVAVALLVSI